jgi:hypothetical protein
VLSTTDIAALTSQAIGALPTATIANMTTDQIHGLTTAQMPGLTSGQIHALTSDQFSIITTADLNAMTTAQWAAVSTGDLVAMTTTQFASIGSADIHALTTAQIHNLTTDDIAAFATAQIAGLTTQQILAMTTDQVHAFTSTDIGVMSNAQVNALIAATPIVLDLNGDGVHTLSAANGVVFDLMGTGNATKVGWVSPLDGLLVRDINHDGKINNGTELFGAGTILSNGQRAGTGFAALADMDSNHDGKITAADAHFSELKVWVDANSNGVVDPGELKSLASLGIVELDLTYKTTSVGDNGNLIGAISSYKTADGKTHEMADVWLTKADPAASGSPPAQPAAGDGASHPAADGTQGGPPTHGDLLAGPPTGSLPGAPPHDTGAAHAGAVVADHGHHLDAHLRRMLEDERNPPLI